MADPAGQEADPSVQVARQPALDLGEVLEVEVAGVEVELGVEVVRRVLESVTNGLPGTSMPSWGVLPERERRQVVQYIKTFSESFNGPPPTPITMPTEVPSSADW